MKTIELAIAQSENDHDYLCYRFMVDGISTTGIFRITADDDGARFLGCAAHAFKLAGILNGEKTKTTEDPRGTQRRVR